MGMPAPQKISLENLRAVAAMLVEDHGPDNVSMRMIADRLQVRAPSLYKHVTDREAVLGLVRDDAVAEVTASLRAAGAEGTSPVARLRAQCHAVRRYALRRPQAFGLVFQPSTLPPTSPAALMASVAPLMHSCGELAGAENALAATRTLTAWLTGFVAMENAAAFQLDGDIDDAFDFGVDAVIAGLGATQRS